MAEQDDLIAEMNRLAQKAKELASQHAEVVLNFRRVQERLAELGRGQGKNVEPNPAAPGDLPPE